MENCAKASLTSINQQFAVPTPRLLLDRYYCKQGHFDLSQPMDKFIPILRDENTNSMAFGMLRAVGENGVKGNEKAVYVIGLGDEPISKIGVSYDPVGRLVSLQGSHYADLHVHAVLFCPTRKSVSIEQVALGRATDMGKRLRGEWVAMKPDDALRLVLETARDNNWPVCDGKTWFDNMAARTRQLVQSRKTAKLSFRQQLRAS